MARQVKAGRKPRIVVKVGTSTLTHPTGLPNIRRMELLVKTLTDLQNSGCQLVLVSSGAMGMGVGRLSLPGRPTDTPGRQAAAAVGQCELMYRYDKLFNEYGHQVSQLLLTRDVVEDPLRKQNVINTFDRLLQWGVIPVVNENDTVATDELEGLVFGDNDTLSAIVATLVEADALILLSDIDGLYTADPRQDPDARLIPVVEAIDEKIVALAGGKGSALGTGGMATKIHAAQIATGAGIDMVILNGEHPELLFDWLQGKAVGTRFIGARCEKGEEACRI